MEVKLPPFREIPKRAMTVSARLESVFPISEQPMRLADQITEALAGFSGCRTMPALIGGLALAAHRVVRATQDVDFLKRTGSDSLNRVFGNPWRGVQTGRGRSICLLPSSS